MSKHTINEKYASLDVHRVSHDDGNLTTNQGVGINNTDDSLVAGRRGPTLMEDFIFREKITHFDHERIPERIVHARGTGVHGHFQVYEDLSHLTKARFLNDPNLITPVFVRFSTVAGFRGSPDTVRDVRGFAAKFYTEEGTYDLVGNNMPVFFIQDAIKFPDLIHALKPEPNNEIPQAASAHDTFWDFVVNTPETMHNVIWLMSPRAVPKSYRMMEGFGIHTFRLVNAKGEFKFVKFHWKPLLGVHSLVWDEAQKIAGKDPDFNRRDLWENVDHGIPAEFELGIQILDPEDEFKFDFDILDATKLWPEEVIPVKIIGKMTLDQNVTNFFAETEQVAFCPGNLVPGIDFTNDPLLQGRLFSYIDTQISRLGGPNFHQIPINRPFVKVNNNQRDGMHRMTIDIGQTSYYPNSLNNGEPHPAREGESYFEHYQEKVEGYIIRERSESFRDHFTQPAMFWNSMSDWEKDHIINAFRFELGKCKNKNTHQKLVDMLGNVDTLLAEKVAEGLGANPPANTKLPTVTPSPALSMANTANSPKTRKVAILIEEGFDQEQFDTITSALTEAGACYDTVSCKLGLITASNSNAAEATHTFATTASVFYDAVYIPGGTHEAALKASPDIKGFLWDTFQHYKTIGASGEGANILCLLQAGQEKEPGILCYPDGNINDFTDEFLSALTKGRHYNRIV